MAISILLSACGSEQPVAGDGDDHKLNVITTTEIIADLVKNVGGDRVSVSSVVPHGGDPHSYEPSPADARRVVEADVAFTNHLLLEEHALIKMFDTNVPEGVPNVSLAEESERYGSHLIPFVEDVGLDVPWLGLAVRGSDSDRTAEVRITATSIDGLGEFFAYVTSVFGEPDVYFNSADGFDETDFLTLPTGAHTHLNWAFTEPGIYILELRANLVVADKTLTSLGTAAFKFAVGVDPYSLGDLQVLVDGHLDIAVDLNEGGLFVCTAALSCVDNVGDASPETVVIEVPNKAISLVPDDPRFLFLGDAGSEIWELPQAVLGKHVHGVIDPHVWEDVKNAQAMVQVIAETLIEADPAGRATYEESRDLYLQELTSLDRYVADKLALIPDLNRNLVTTHDAFGYLAEAYGLRVAGFVVPNPAQDPSAIQVTRLTETIRNLEVPAVFLEPNLASRATVLQQVADDHDVKVCKLYGDSFDEDVLSYVEMMRATTPTSCCVVSEGEHDTSSHFWSPGPGRCGRGDAVSFTK